VGEDAGEIGTLQDANVLDPPAGLLARLQLQDGVDAEPASPHGEAEDLVERDEREFRRARREDLLVAVRPRRDPIHGHVAQLRLAEWAEGRVGGAKKETATQKLAALRKVTDSK
jgi:hypothetical protein